MDIQELNKTVTDGMKAFEAAKENLATKEQFEQLDGETKGKFEKAFADIEKALEAGEKIKGLEAAKEQLEKKQAEMETAFSRAPQATTSEEKELVTEKRNALFNQFVKQQNGPREEYFDQFVDRTVTDETERKSLSVGSDVDGGYTVMPEQGGVIETVIYESSPIRQLADSITIGTDAWEFVDDYDEAAFGWVGETQSRTETNTPVLGKVRIPVHEMYAEPRLTQKVIDDSQVDIEGWLNRKVADKFARGEATAFVSGDGVNKPRGFMTYDAGTARGQIEQVNSGSGTTFTYDGLVDLQSSLKEEYQANATFMLQRGSIADIMKIKDDQARPIFNMMYDKNTGLEPTILGRPVRFANDIAAVSGGALAAVYGDFRQAYLIVDRVGIRILRDMYTAKPFIKLYTTKRVGGDVVRHEALKIQKIAS